MLTFVTKGTIITVSYTHLDVYKRQPYQPSTFIMFYNKDAFAKAGITATPTTWDEFLAACEALKTAGIIPMTVDDAYMACLFGFLMDRIAGSDTTEAVAARCV